MYRIQMLIEINTRNLSCIMEVTKIDYKESDIIKCLKECDAINKKIIEIEKKIYRLEGDFLEETGFKGSVLKGWESLFTDLFFNYYD
ncbi:hypothetical protein MXB_5022 [Myxobolus squamalis]|nr:hypothetical protein MXB_5022 [Myxobolus squamalis]